MLFQSFKKLKKLQKQSLLLHSIVLASIILSSIIFMDPIITLITGGILHAILSIVVLLYEKRDNLIIITPVSIFFLYIFFSYGLAAIFIAGELSKINFIEFVNQLVYDKSVEQGYLINNTGLFFMHLGLQIFRPRKNIFTVKYNNSIPKLFLYFTIGIIFLLNPILSFYLGSFFVSSIVWLPISIVLYIVLIDKRSLNLPVKQKKIIVVALTIIILALQVFSLSKLNILLSLLPVVWLLIKEGEKIWKTVVTFIFIILFYAYFIYPFVTSARQNFVPMLVSNNLIGELSSSPEVRSYLLKGEYADDVQKVNPDQNAVEAFFYRMFDCAPSGYISDEVERRGFTYGATMDYVLYGFIPRVLWPDKPTTSRGGWFTRYIGVNYATAIAMTSYGELYWNFGFIGVIIGMFIIGSLYAGLWRISGLEPQNSVLSVWLYFIVLYGMMVHSEAGSVFIAIIQYYIFFGGLILFRNSFLRKNIARYSTVSG